QQLRLPDRAAAVQGSRDRIQRPGLVAVHSNTARAWLRRLVHRPGHHLRRARRGADTDQPRWCSRLHRSRYRRLRRLAHGRETARKPPNAVHRVKRTAAAGRAAAITLISLTLVTAARRLFRRLMAE